MKVDEGWPGIVVVMVSSGEVRVGQLEGVVRSVLNPSRNLQFDAAEAEVLDLMIGWTELQSWVFRAEWH